MRPIWSSNVREGDRRGRERDQKVNKDEKEEKGIKNAHRSQSIRKRIKGALHVHHY
jgi:hypothetical protein